MSFPSFSIERKVTAEHGDCLVFSPPLNTPELDAALEMEYPHILSAKERKQKAVLDFFVSEQERDQMMKEREQIRLQKEQLDLQQRQLEERSQQLEQALAFSVTPADLALPLATPLSPSADNDLFVAPDLPLFDTTDVAPTVHTGASPMFDFLDTPADSLWLNDSPVNQTIGNTTPQDLLLLSPIDLLAVSSVQPGPSDPMFECPPSATTACLTTPSDTPRSVSAFDTDTDLFNLLSENPCPTPATGFGADPLTNIPSSLLFGQPSTTTSPMLFNGSWSNTPILDSFHISSPQFTVEQSPAPKVMTAPTPADVSRQISEESESGNSAPSIDNFTSVWSLFPEAQPKRRTRRRMTEAEKKEYRVKRRSGACDDCRRRRRKCHRAEGTAPGSGQRKGFSARSCRESSLSVDAAINQHSQRGGTLVNKGAILMNQDIIIDSIGGSRRSSDSSSSSGADNVRVSTTIQGGASPSRTISCPRGEPVSGFDGSSSSQIASGSGADRTNSAAARMGVGGHQTNIHVVVNDGGVFGVESDNLNQSANISSNRVWGRFY